MLNDQVARSRLSDARVWTRARDCLGLLSEPAICMSVLGSSRHPKGEKYPGTVNWGDGGTKMIAHVPFYILAGQAGELLVEFGSHVGHSAISDYTFSFVSNPCSYCFYYLSWSVLTPSVYKYSVS